MIQPTEISINKINRFVDNFCKNSGTFTSPEEGVKDAVVLGLASNLDIIQKPLCPCRVYPDKNEEIKHRTWICPCDDMNVYKYCHCLLFVDQKGDPITEYLPENHEGRTAHVTSEIKDPTPDKGRVLKDKAVERELERINRIS